MLFRPHAWDPKKETEDIQEIAAIFCEGIRKKHSHQLGFFPEKTYILAVKRGRIRIAEMIIQFDSPFGKQGATIQTGFVFFGLRKPEARIYQICLNPEWRGKGLGREMVEEVQREATKSGCAIVTLRCRGDLQANDFWDHLGYENYKTEDTKNTRKSPIRSWMKEVVFHPQKTGQTVQKKS